MKTLLLIAFFVVPFCNMIASQSTLSERMLNNNGSSHNLSHCDSDTLNTFSNTLNNFIGINWNQMTSLLAFADATKSKAYINLNYEAVWLHLQRNTSMLHVGMFEFAAFVENNIYLTREFKENVILGVFSEVARLLTDLLYPINDMETELNRTIFEYFNSYNDTELAIVFNRMYDDLLGRKSAVSIANRLYILPFSNKQLTTAYLELSRRNEVKTDEESAAIKRNLIELCGRENVTLTERILRKADTIRIGSKFLKDKGSPYHVGLCQNTTNPCVPGQESVNVQVERLFKENTEYAFKIPGAGYINFEENTATLTEEIFWWNAISVYDTLYIRLDDVFFCANNNPTGVIAVHDQFEEDECAWIIKLGI